jgi:alanine-synthesizing transaminase
MFSSRVPSNLAPNRLAAAVERLRVAGRSIVDLTESNPTRAGFAYPENLLRGLSDRGSLVYAPVPRGLAAARAAVVADYRRRGISISPERISLTASSSESYSMLFKLLCDPGDEVLVPRPSYPLFDHLTALDGVVARPYDLEYHGSWSIDVTGLANAMSARTRAVLIVSPNNPTGSFVRAHELEAIAAACVRQSVAVIADEVFADYELADGATSAAGVPLSRQDLLVFSLGGLSKTVGLPQIKLGWIAASGPAPVVDEAMARLDLVCDTYLSVSTPVQHSAAELLEIGAAVRSQIQARIKDNLRALAASTAAQPAVKVLQPEAGWCAVLHVPTLCSEEELVLDLLHRQGVLVHPGYFFDFPRESFLIVSLLPPPASFADGITRVLRHFDCSVTRHRD